MVPAACRWVCIPILSWFALWNFSKLPFFWENMPMTNVTYDVANCTVPEPLAHCKGLMTQYNLFRAFGIESGYKLRSDKDLFFIPHAAMGIALEVLFVLALLEGKKGLYKRSRLMFPLAFVFALHILPAAPGIPNNLSGAPINEILIVLIVACCIMGWFGMCKAYKANGNHVPARTDRAEGPIYWAWLGIGVLVNTAPLGEWFLIFSGGKEVPQPDVPHPESGHDFYAKANCPWLGRIVAMFVLFTVFMYIFDNYAEHRGEGWRSAFNKKGLALWQIARAPYPETNVNQRQRPELLLEATGECFVLCIMGSWMITSMFNPGVFRDNILRTLVGYNNLCVGFDTAPARYFAMPLLTLQAVLAGRYSYMDTIRLNAEKDADELTKCQYWFGYIVNTIFALWMLCFPMLLVIVADFNSWLTTKIHLYLFMTTLFIMWLMIAGNVMEAEEVELPTRIWFGLFTAHTFLLPVVGVIDILTFHPELDAEDIWTIRYEHPHPTVPWPVTAYLDYGWFVLLLLTVVFLPDSPPVQVQFRCDLAETYGFIEGEIDDEEKHLTDGYIDRAKLEDSDSMSDGSVESGGTTERSAE